MLHRYNTIRVSQQCYIRINRKIVKVKRHQYNTCFTSIEKLLQLKVKGKRHQYNTCFTSIEKLLQLKVKGKRHQYNTCFTSIEKLLQLKVKVKRHQYNTFHIHKYEYKFLNEHRNRTITKYVLSENKFSCIYSLVTVSVFGFFMS